MYRHYYHYFKILLFIFILLNAMYGCKSAEEIVEGIINDFPPGITSPEKIEIPKTTAAGDALSATFSKCNPTLTGAQASILAKQVRRSTARVDSVFCLSGNILVIGEK